jgi:hypothetical protein
MPDLGMVLCCDAETGAIELINTGSKAVRTSYENTTMIR